MNKYLANDKKQDLYEHVLGVAKKALEIIDSYNIKDKEIYKILIYTCYYSAILHDIGKVHLSFQTYIKKQKLSNCDFTDAEALRRKKFVGPYHNEISFSFSAKCLQFDSDSNHKIINYAIYWHHPANTKDKKFIFDSYEKIYDKALELDKDIKDKLQEFFDNVNKIRNNFCFFEKYKNYISQNEFSKRTDIPDFVGINCDLRERSLKKLVLFTLIQADRFISKLSKDDLTNYLNNNFKTLDNIEEIQKNKKYFFKEIKSHELRSIEQYELAKKISENKMAIFAGDPGSGKTSITIKWHALNNQESSRPLFFVLPKQHQVTGLFNTLKKDMDRILNSTDDISIEGVFSGKRQHEKDTNKNEIITSDINIMVFDRFLSPCYERNQYDQFMLSLKSDLVIDEFHEFCWLYSMINPLKEIIKIRSWINDGSKTLFLSGTPDPSLRKVLFESDIKFFNRNYLSPVNKTKTFVSYSKDFPNYILPDTLISFNTIDKSHEYMIDKDINNILHIHSKFTESHKKEKIEEILNEHNIKDSNKSTITAKILQSSFDLNYRNGYLVCSHPNTDAQTIGRINRFDNKGNGKIVFIPESNTSIFDKNRLGHKEINNKWHEFLKSKFSLENFSKEKEYSIREILNIYDNFWENSENIRISQKFIEEKSEKDFNLLKDWFPSREDIYRFKKNNDIKVVSSKPRFRGVSLLVSAAVYDNNGNCISQLEGEDLLTIAYNKYIKEDLRQATMAATKSIVKNREIGHFNLNFLYNKRQRCFGYKETAPLLYSFMELKDYNNIKTTVSNILKEDESIYNEFFGLIKLELFNKLKKGLSQKKMIAKDNEIKKIKTRLNVNEYKYLIPLSRRHPLFYVEYCKIIRKENDIRLISCNIDEKMSTSLPVANIGALLIGPGCSITSEAARIITSRGCLLCFTGGGLVPLFLISSQHRSPLTRIRQYKISFSEDSRVKLGKILLNRRKKLLEDFNDFELPIFPSSDNLTSIEQLNLLEAAWAKRAYRKLATDFKVPWTNKEQENINKDNPITFLNFLSYSIADIAIYHLGYDPNIGILHGRTKGGGLAYDLADVIKPIVALVPSFYARQKNLKLSEIKSRFISDIIRNDLLDYLIKTIELLFNHKDEKEIS